MATLNISEYEKQALYSLICSLKTKWPSTKFVLFGSKVKEIADEESDIDLLIVLPCEVTAEIRNHIIKKVFNVNLSYGSNISVLIVSEDEWHNGKISVLPIHHFIEEEGVSI